MMSRREQRRGDGGLHDRGSVEPMGGEGRHEDRGVLRPLMNTEQLEPGSKPACRGMEDRRIRVDPLSTAFKAGGGETAIQCFAAGQTARSAPPLPT